MPIERESRFALAFRCESLGSGLARKQELVRVLCQSVKLTKDKLGRMLLSSVIASIDMLSIQGVRQLILKVIGGEPDDDHGRPGD